MRNRITYLLACLIVSGSSLAQSVYKDNTTVRQSVRKI